MKTPSAWICQSCGRPIFGGDGTIEIVNANVTLGPVGTYPRAPSDDHGTPNIEFLVYHSGSCDLNVEHQGYWFSTDRAETLAAWCGWMAHLFEKSWMGRSDLERFLHLWWKNRGLTLSSAPT